MEELKKYSVRIDAGVHILTVRNDIVLYEIDEDAGVVRVLNIFTRGKDLTRE